MSLIKKLGRGMAYLALITTMLSPLQASNGSLKDDLKEVKREVKSQRTGYYTTTAAPLDTVWVFRKGGKTIESGSDFTSFKSEGDDQSSFLYDIGNDGKADRVIFTDGRVKRSEQVMIDLEGLGGTKKLEVELGLNDMIQDMQGRTPYNTRRIYAINHADSTVGVYDFEKNQHGKFAGDFGLKSVIKLQGLYKRDIDYSKKLLGISQ